MNQNKVIHPLKPIYTNTSKYLFLGSFPSVISRKDNMYYANPNNRFWKVMSVIFEEEIEDKEKFCYKHDIALWDVIRECSIIGSSDASIKDIEINDIESLIKNSDIKVICTNGSKATSLYDKYIDLDIKHVSLPSTSSANARFRLEDLVKEYRKVFEWNY